MPPILALLGDRGLEGSVGMISAASKRCSSSSWPYCLRNAISAAVTGKVHDP